MEAMREAWTDDRLDDLNRKVDEGFRGVDTDIRELRGEMNERFDKVNERFDKIDDRFYAMQRTMLFGALALSSAFVAGFAALVGLFATQI
jgi:hypothetical protein